MLCYYNVYIIIIIITLYCIEKRNDTIFIGAAIGIVFLLIAVSIIIIIIGSHWLLRRRKRRLEYIHEVS